MYLVTSRFCYSSTDNIKSIIWSHTSCIRTFRRIINDSIDIQDMVSYYIIK